MVVPFYELISINYMETDKHDISDRMYLTEAERVAFIFILEGFPFPARRKGRVSLLTLNKHLGVFIKEG